MQNQTGADKTEVVVIGGPNDPTKRASLEFRRSEGRDADLAQVGVAIDGNLKAVAVDELHRCVLRNRDAAVVYISNDAVILMDHGKGARNIGCNAQKKPKIRSGKF